ncbi:MAG: substrate-binding domain-containing protein [Marinovum sp.]|nr:substrate-binding domain-containing protein [Marinovum sp.]
MFAQFRALMRTIGVGATLGATVAFSGPPEVIYQKSLDSSDGWTLPSAGPAAAADQSVLFVAASLRNSGILGVAEGVVEAASVIGWSVEVADARGSGSAIAALLQSALTAPPDALILGGFDATTHETALQALSDAGSQIVGWHAGPLPGPLAGTPIFFNVTTDPLEVARVAAQHAIVESGPDIGVVIFTDERYEIAVAKSNAMKDIIDACATCRMLEVVNVPLDETTTRMPILVEELLAKYGDAWTVSLGINDLYFDDAVVPFSLAGVAPRGQIANISAGDGSLTAYKRIRIANYQDATVPEPLNFQGWQIIDELNRAISGERPSGFVAPTKLVFFSNVDDEGGERNVFDPANGYRENYQAIWTVEN